MADYIANSRTNYFKVKDRNAFLEELRSYSFEDLDINEREDEPGKIALLGYSDISDMWDEENEESVPLADLISNHIEKDDACILMVAGHEKLRYITAYAVVITSGGYNYIDVENVALATAAQMLGTEEFNTRMYH